ncbi:MAG: dephospho-CoA kinase [Pseudonocardia sp.]
MLRVGLTGGIGAGKSTVARRLVELGATLVDADQVAREVVRPGSIGLARVVEQFGDRVLDVDGALDRPALADIVFVDEAARRRLNGILHPLIGHRTAELMAAAPPDAVLVQDVPLLVEGVMGALFPLVVVVDAPENVRISRLVSDRGMTEQAARARIAAQADSAARRAAADVWLDNSGSPDGVRDEVDRLWRERLVPFEAAVRTGTSHSLGPPVLVEPDPSWPQQFDRLATRIVRATGGAVVRTDHVGSTAVPELSAKDVIDIQLGVHSLDDVDAWVPGLREVGFLERPKNQGDNPKPVDPDPEHWRKRMFVSADPGRPVHVHVRELGSAGYRFALIFRDWLRADPDARADYLVLKRQLAEAHAGDPDRVGYSEGKERWFDESLDLANRWAMRSGWRMPSDPPITESTQKM